MKYRFITALYNFELEDLGHENFNLKSNGSISKSIDILNETFSNRLAYDTIGAHSLDEFKGRFFYFHDGEFDKDISESIIQQRGTKFTYSLLRHVEQFVLDLWNIKDNNTYVFEGFLFVYTNEIKDGFTFKATVSTVLSKSDLSYRNTIFSKHELHSLIKNMDNLNFHNLFTDETDYYYATSDHFYKHSNAKRTDQAWYFILAARAGHALPTKIVFYCTALECLFTTSQSELSHRISERVATLLGGSSQDKVNTYKLVKKAYDVRSKIVHGSLLKGENNDLKEVSSMLDEILRVFLTGDFPIFNKNDNEINEFFLNELFVFE